VGLVEAGLLAAATWLLFAYITGLYFWAVSADKHRVGIAKLIDRAMTRGSPPTRREPAALRASSGRARTVVMAAVGALLVGVGQWLALSVVFDPSPAVEPAARVVMLGLAAALAWSAYLGYDLLRIRRMSA